MRVEFNQGVSDEVIKWLWDNVGEGNLTNLNDSPEYDWFYKRERVYPQPHDPFDPGDLSPKFVPTITVKDPKLGTLFALRWS